MINVEITSAHYGMLAKMLMDDGRLPVQNDSSEMLQAMIERAFNDRQETSAEVQLPLL